MKISQDECRRWVERATTQAANAVALFDEAKRLQKENAVLRAEVERYRSILSILEDEVYASASRVLPPTAVQSDEFNTLDVSDVCNRLVAEVERLREECDFWRSHLHIDSPKMDGQHTWRLMWNHFTLVGSDAGEVVRNALEAIRSQPLPAPPMEEE